MSEDTDATAVGEQEPVGESGLTASEEMVVRHLQPLIAALVAQARADGAAEERERIANACEDEARDYEATRQETTAYVVRRVVSEAYEHAARIARAQP